LTLNGHCGSFLVMEQFEDIKVAKDILQNVIKAKKTLRMYPENNPMYQKTLEDLYTKFRDFFNYKDELLLRIKQHSIFFDSEEIYHNPEKEDNLALFFFKDGLRELTFKKEILQEELEEFLKIIVSDFDKESLDDDIVTLLWERDFQNIKYIVDDTILLDADGEEYEINAINSAKQKVSDIEGLMKAYAEEFKDEDIKDAPVISFSDRDLQILMKEIENDASNKMEKLSDIILEIFYQSEEMGSSFFEDNLKYLKQTIKLSMSQGDINTVIHAIRRAKETYEDPSSAEQAKQYTQRLLTYPASDEIINILGELLNSGIEIDDKTFKEFIELLDKKAIPPLVKILGELKTLRIKEKIIDALVFLGRQDIKTLAMALNDKKWYVVRNIIYILRKIRDKGAVEYLLKTIGHEDARVRKEIVRALSELGGKEALQPLKERLDDADAGVRTEAVRAIGNIGSVLAKKIILENISNKRFKERDFEEKKGFYEVLSRWKDPEVLNFLTKSLRKSSFFWWIKNYENMACAAYCLGLLDNKDALPFLYRHKNSKNKHLKEFAQAAIERIEHGR
jgi:HEAT repeat protein